MVDRNEQLRAAAIRNIARDLKIDLEEAQGWCEAWERFAERHGGARSRNFWDSARGWIDAQRSFTRAGPSPSDFNYRRRERDSSLR
jgi:hypothetical protein